MSITLIQEHDETIYKLQEKEEVQYKKPPRYHSKFQGKIKEDIKAVKSAHKTMGYAEVPLRSPSDYLVIGGGIRPKPKVSDHKCKVSTLPPVPHAEPFKRIRKEKDFPKENILAVRKMTPNRPIPKFVDTNVGNLKDLRKSGLMPSYIYQPKFGKLPKYLIKRIRDAVMQEEMLRDEEARKKPLCRYVTQEERAELLAGLKYNWEELQKTYQGLPVLTDTIPKGIRKTNLENELKQLERDILMVENHPYIYVYDK